jgi:niacin transporter
MTSANQTKKIITMCIAAMLSAIGIIIPMFSPFKIIIEPASFTLASHVPIFIAMFISPLTAVFVAVITAFGFLMAGVFPPVVVFRALTHIIFALVGAYILKKNNNILLSLKTAIPFVLGISLIHAVFEVIVSSIFYFTGQSTASYVVVVLGLVGAGTVVHSTFDFILASLIWVPLQHVINIPVNAKIRLRTAKVNS